MHSKVDLVTVLCKECGDALVLKEQMALEQSSIHSIHSIRADKLLGALSREESWWDSVFNVSILNVVFGFCMTVSL